jgi:hypothetical protein
MRFASSEAGCLMNLGMIFQRLALNKSDFGEAMGSHSQSQHALQLRNGNHDSSNNGVPPITRSLASSN